TVVADTVITSPADGATLANPHPTVTGTAEPGESVMVVFWGPGAPGVPTCLVLADAATGTFQCSSPDPLGLGGYQVIAESGAGITSDPLSMTIVDADPTITSPTAG